MDYNKIPSFIRESVILDASDLSRLASIDHIPSDQEVDAIRSIPEIQELLNAFIGDVSTRTTHLEIKAKERIAANDIPMAWKVLLL
ncbi:hypothetical protein E2P86_10535 [Sphingobacterium psychroaquaticum]|uniref:hypothetical protein n=1 Tax=Sphingobacterium psychroaquaticum TaxID=561061 RepID=UPI00106A9184|nr:hypothetical protein [Sphingobacterium psychroaquaticum]QBQ41561.1 hypothetical protein E2P86_10535 [Sphingobacterium psychroaquaticum]